MATLSQPQNFTPNHPKSITMDSAPTEPALPSSHTPLVPTTAFLHRLYHLDNLRSSLTALVIMHHVSIPYGGLGSWPYRSRFHTSGSSPTLIAFNSLNQSYFMGSFFYLSGLMTPPSFRRRGRNGFLKTKWTKLGIPVVAYGLFGPPLLTVIQKLFERKPLSWDILTTDWTGIRGVRGAVWYTATLLIFDSVYAFLPPTFTFDLSTFTLLPTILLDITASFLIRILYPVGTVWTPLNLQLGYLPQYIICYVLGTISKPPTAESPSLLTPTQRKGLICGSIISGASILGLLHYDPQTYTLSSASGGLNPVALAYAIWNETTGCLIGSAILAIFRENDWASRKWGNVGRYSYAAFLVHPIVCVVLQFACDGWDAYGVLKTAVVGTVGVLGSWMVGWGLTLIPGVRSVVT